MNEVLATAAMSGADRRCCGCCELCAITVDVTDGDPPTAPGRPRRRRRCCGTSCRCHRHFVIALLVVTATAAAAAVSVVAMATESCDGCGAGQSPPEMLWRDATSRLKALGPPATFALFVVLYAAASLPFVCGGYSALNVAGGYVYGLAGGALLSACCAAVGAMCVRLAMAGPVRACSLRALSAAASAAGASRPNFLAGAAAAVTTATPDRRQLLQMVFVARLTPVPFGLQNALFSVSGLPLAQYLTATCLGLLPMQILNSYLGSTLRSMDEIFTNNHTPAAWLALCGQVLLSIGLTIFIATKARKRFSEIFKQTGGSLDEGVAIALPAPCVV